MNYLQEKHRKNRHTTARAMDETERASKQETATTAAAAAAATAAVVHKITSNIVCWPSDARQTRTAPNMWKQHTI